MTLTLTETLQGWFQRDDLIGTMQEYISPTERSARQGKKALLGLCYCTEYFNFKYFFQNAFIVLSSEILEKHFLNQFQLVAHVLQAKKSFLVYLYTKKALKETTNQGLLSVNG